MSTYQPNAQFHEAVKLLEATQDPDHQKAATAKIQQLGATEAFQNALMAIMLHGGRHGVPVDVRQSAGLSIKNNLRRYTANQRATAKRLSLLLLNEPDHTIRGLAGTMIAHIVRTEGLDSWPELAPDLVAKLRNTKNVAAAAGSLETLFKIVEDTGDLIMTAGGGHSKGYGDVITTLLIAYLRHPTSKCRVLALKVFMVLVYQQPIAFDVHLSEIVGGLAKLCPDPDVEVQIKLVETLSSVVDMYVKYPVFQEGSTFASICQYMLRSVFHANEDVMQAAIVFWSEACTIDAPFVQRIVMGHMPRLLPFFFQKLELQEDDPDLVAIDDDWTVPDRPQDAVPRKYAKMTGFYSGNGEDGEDDDGDDDDGDGDGGDDAVDQLTTRRKAGRALSNFASGFRGRVLPFVLPSIKAGLAATGPQAWLKKEAAMLALGSVGEHCLEQLAPSMPGLVGLVHNNLDSENASLVGISCWWLGQFGQWFAEQALEGRTGPLEVTVRKVMKLFLNPKKSIQFSAMSCVAFLIEESRQFFRPMLLDLLKVIFQGTSRYQAKSIVASLDVIRTLAEQDELEESMQSESVSKAIIQLTVGRWLQIAKPSDRLHVSIMDTLFYVLPRLNKGVVRSAIQKICQLTMQLFMTAAASLLQLAQTERDATLLKHEMDDWFEFFVCALYLLDCAVELLEADFARLRLDSRLVPAILRIASFKNAHVNDAIFSFLGDISVHCFKALVEPHADVVFLTVRQSIAPRFREMSSNAIWTLGEIAQRSPAATLLPHAAHTMEQVRLVLRFWRQHGYDSATKNLLLNCIILINALGERVPQVVAAAFSRGDGGKEMLWQWLVQLTHTMPTTSFEIKQRGTIVAVKLLCGDPKPFMAPADPASCAPRFRNAMALLDLVHSWMHFLRRNPEARTPPLEAGLKKAVAVVQEKYVAAQLWAPFFADIIRHRPDIAKALNLSA